MCCLPWGYPWPPISPSTPWSCYFHSFSSLIRYRCTCEYKIMPATEHVHTVHGVSETLLLFESFLLYGTLSLQQSKVIGVVKFVSCVSVWSGLLLFVSQQLTGSWDFLEAVYGVM